MNPALCLATCFLPLDAENARWWKRFRDELARCGMELILLSYTPAADPELRTILLPLHLQDFGHAYDVPSEPVTLEAPLADALTRRDRAWSGQEELDLSGFHTGLAACQHVLRTILNELQPAVVLVWGNSLPQSVILQQLALQQGRPCWMIERGLLPGMLMIEMSGQSGQSELNWSFTLNRALRESRGTELFFAAQAASRRNPETKYVQADYLSPAAFHERFNPERRKLVAFALHQAAASCLLPADYLGVQIHAPGFRSSEEAIRALGEAAREQDAVVLVKPHPVDSTDYSHLENAHLRIRRDVNLHSLIAAADVVACMTSTAQYEALLHEKPLLLMARSQLVGKGAAYEALTPAALPDAMRAALERRGYATLAEAARRFLHFILRHFSVALSDSTPTGATLTDLSQFLFQNALHPANAPSSEQRLAALQRSLETWTKPAQQVHARFDADIAAPRLCRTIETLRGAEPDSHARWASRAGTILQECESLIERGELATAAERLEQVVANVPEHLEATLTLGNVRYALGDIESAARQFERATAIAPNQAAAYALLASLRVQQERFAEAEAAARQALELEPLHLEMLRMLAALARHDERFAEAHDYYASIARLETRDVEARIGQAVCCAAQGHCVLAELLLEEALELQPGHPEALALQSQINGNHSESIATQSVTAGTPNPGRNGRFHG